MLQE
jgi:hypothetical protein